MSQAKVDAYKEEKVNRKKNLKKKKAAKLAGRICAWVVALAILCGIGTSIYRVYEDKRPAKTYQADLSAIENFVTDNAAE